MKVLRRLGGMWFMLLCLTACSGGAQPAKDAIAEIRATVTASAGDAAKYLPEQLLDVQTRLDELQSSFDRKDYASVSSAAPAVMGAAHQLGIATAAKKSEALSALEHQWAGLVAALPRDLGALRDRIEVLCRNSTAKPKGIDLEATQAALSAAASLWSKAQAAFATGNLDEAVSIAAATGSQLMNLAAALKMELPAPTRLPAAPESPAS